MICIDPDVVVISLRRTPERLARFHAVNETGGIRWIEGVDGIDLWSTVQTSRALEASAREGWSRGAIGAALSHLLCWRQCLNSGRPMLILEDDAVLSRNWRSALADSLHTLPDVWDLLLLGWNYNSVLRRQDGDSVESISLFEPAFPTLTQIRSIIDTTHQRRWHRLYNGFGLPGYLINPRSAKLLLHDMLPLRTERIHVGRGIPSVEATTLDGLLNLAYHEMHAYVIHPPLAIATNDQATSLTQRTSRQINYGTGYSL